MRQYAIGVIIMRQNKVLLKMAKQADKECNKFWRYMSDKYPDLNLGICGCLEFSNFTMEVSNEQFMEIHPRRFEKAKAVRL